MRDFVFMSANGASSDSKHYKSVETNADKLTVICVHDLLRAALWINDAYDGIAGYNNIKLTLDPQIKYYHSVHLRSYLSLSRVLPVADCLIFTFLSQPLYSPLSYNINIELAHVISHC